MNEKEKEIVNKIVHESVLKKITWDKFMNYFPIELQKSSNFFEILNEIQNKGIEIIDKIEYSEIINELELSTYIIAQANSFADVLPTLRKYPDGDMFTDYLKGMKMQTIAESKGIEKVEVVKRLKKFARYISCSEIEVPLLGVYVNYDLKPKDFSAIMCIDEVTSKYLYLKFATLPDEDKKHYKVSQDFLERLKDIPKR